MLYIHIPYCKGKCIYCDFYSGSNPDWDKYLKAVASELSERIDELRGDCLSSIYIGGGTPSLIPPEDFICFMEGIYEELSINDIKLSPELEVTIEVNPEDVDVEHADAWQKGGINRVSMGVQSLVDSELRVLRRRHTADKAEIAAKILRNHFENVSLDLIYGIPGQTPLSLRETLERLVSLRPTHISAYALTYESGTPLEVLRLRGDLRECSEEEYIELEKLVSRYLQKSGYERYEISNYSMPGFRSRHNSGYWTGKPYVGLGPSASSFDGVRTRRTNLPDLKRYVSVLGNRDSEVKEDTPYYEIETLSEAERAEETVMISLRRKEGLNLALLGEYAEAVAARARRWIGTGDLNFSGERLSLTEKGISISDHIILDLVTDIS